MIDQPGISQPNYTVLIMKIKVLIFMEGGEVEDGCKRGGKKIHGHNHNIHD